jgi:hypothetical protein
MAQLSVMTNLIVCYATFGRGLALAEKVGVQGVGSIKFRKKKKQK